MIGCLIKHLPRATSHARLGGVGAAKVVLAMYKPELYVIIDRGLSVEVFGRVASAQLTVSFSLLPNVPLVSTCVER